MTRAMGAAMRRIQVGNALSAFGLGFTVPYLYVYVAQVRGLGASTAGLVLAVFAVAALIVLPFAGRAIDRRGPLPVLLVAAGHRRRGRAEPRGSRAARRPCCCPRRRSGPGTAVMQPALATMIVWCSTRRHPLACLRDAVLPAEPRARRRRAHRRAARRHVARRVSFTLLFAIEAAMFLVLGGRRWRPCGMPHSPRIEDAARATVGAEGGWKQLLGNRAMVQLCVLGFVLFFACYGQFESGLSRVRRRGRRDLAVRRWASRWPPTRPMIVVAQFAVLKFVERRRRSRVIAAVGLIWAVAWVVAGYAGLGHGSQEMATAAFISTYALFGLGEAMLSPTVAPLVADLAPEWDGRAVQLGLRPGEAARAGGRAGGGRADGGRAARRRTS